MRKARLSFSILASALLAAASPTSAADFTVTDCGDSGSPNQLRAKISAANGLPAGGSIDFTCGPATIVLASTLPVIGKPMSIFGGGKITISGGNTVQMFITNVDLYLQDITLSHGLATDGGAVLVAVTGELSGRNVVFENNSATNDGGAIYANLGGVFLYTSEFRENHAGGDGGGIYNYYSDVELFDVDFNENTADAFSAAVSNDGGYVKWEGGTAYRNHGADCGVMDTYDADGEVTQGQAEITGVKFLDNKSLLGDGGALVVFQEGTVDAWDVLFQDNEAAEGGGAVANYGWFELTGGAFVHNNATVGGAVKATSTTSFENVTFSDNYADVAQTIWTSVNSDVYLNRVTLVGADIGTGANIQSTGGKFYLNNSILMRPTAGGVNCSAMPGAYVSQGFNRVDDASCGLNATGDINSANPKLGPIADNGGPTPTHLPLPGGSLVDTGNLTGCPETDQRGIDRPQQAACDIGAVEVVDCDPPVPQVCGDPTGDGQIKSADALRSLRASVGSLKCGLWLCDYNGNGSIAASDALAILKRAVGQPSSPKCPAPWDCRAELYS